MTVDRSWSATARRPLSDARDPARAGVEPELPRVEGVPRSPTGAGRPLRLRRARRAGDRAERGELAQPIVAGSPDLLAEVVLAARREQARRSGTCCCGAPALVCSPPASCVAAPPARRRPRRSGGSGMCSRASSGGIRSAPLGLELELFANEATEEGIAGQNDRAPSPVSPDGQDGAGPRECARLHAQCAGRRWSSAPSLVDGDRERFTGLLLRRRPACRLEARVALGRELLAEGADILDIGGGSGATGRPAVDAARRDRAGRPARRRVVGDSTRSSPSTPTSPPSRAPRSRRGPSSSTT